MRQITIEIPEGLTAREAMEATIEALIHRLDAMEPDPDMEPDEDFEPIDEREPDRGDQSVEWGMDQRTTLRAGGISA